jgi:hypothetical protein
MWVIKSNNKKEVMIDSLLYLRSEADILSCLLSQLDKKYPPVFQQEISSLR